MLQVADHGLAHVDGGHLGQLEHDGRGDVRLLQLALAAKEHARLAVVVGKTLGADTAFSSAIAVVCLSEVAEALCQ
ncbi:hypothetical protein D3C72_2398540 [compost metagenome]